MSDDANKPTQGDGAQDAVGNLKAEMNRKLGNLEESNKQLLAALQELRQPKAAPAPQPTAPQKKMSDLMYENPDEFVEQVVASANKTARNIIDSEARKNQVFAQLYSDYPEFTDQNSDLSKKTIEYLSQIPKELRDDPREIKLAARDAAADLGVMPKSKRPSSQNDDFSLGGNSSYSGEQRRSSSAKADKQQEEAVMEIASVFATAFKEQGHDVDSDKFKKRITGRAKRNFGRYE